MGQYDNMLMAFMELPDDIDAIVQYNDGVNFQLVLRSPHSPTKTTWTRTSIPAWEYTDENGVRYGQEARYSLHVVRDKAEPLEGKSIVAFRNKQARVMRAFMRPAGRKIT